jgi:hypothetical protein
VEKAPVSAAQHELQMKAGKTAPIYGVTGQGEAFRRSMTALAAIVQLRKIS